MVYNQWDIEQALSAYRKKKQDLYCSPQTDHFDDFTTPKPYAVPLVQDFTYTTHSSDRDFLATLEKELPPVFTRQLAAQRTGGLISAKTLSNLDSLNRGPSVKVRVGTKVGYERSSFMQWLRGRMKY